MYGSGYGIHPIENTILQQPTLFVLMCQAPNASSGVVAGASMRGARVFPTATGAVPPSAAATWVFDFCAPSRRVGSFGPFEEQVTWVLFSPSTYSPRSHRTSEPDVVGVLSLYTFLLRTLGSMTSGRNLFVENQSETRR